MTEDFRSLLVSALQTHRPRRVTAEGARAAAVLIPIVAEPHPSLIFTVRTTTVRSHKGQISFPGGSIDAGDASARDAALREAEEEIGLAPPLVEVVGELDTFPTFVSGYVVTPFVGWLREQPALEPNPAEVASLLHVPVSALSNEVRAAPGFSHRGRTYPTEAWIWEGHVIWGVTARIIRQLLLVLSAAGLAEAPEGDEFWIPPAST